MFKKLIKFLFKTFVCLIAIVLIALVVIYFTAGIWIKPLVGTIVPKFTKTNASLASADVSLFSGRFGLKGLKVANPNGFNEPYAFELGEIFVQFQPKTIMNNKIIVDKVLIKGTKIAAEYNKAFQMNLMVLNENVQSSLKTLSNEQQNSVKNVQTKQNTPPKKSVVIKDLQILNTSVRFATMGRSVTIDLPNIHEKNIGEKKKMTLEQTIQMITDRLTLDPIKEMAKSGQKALGNAFKVIEEHTTDHRAIGQLKDVLSNAKFF